MYRDMSGTKKSVTVYIRLEYSYLIIYSSFINVVTVYCFVSAKT